MRSTPRTCPSMRCKRLRSRPFGRAPTAGCSGGRAVCDFEELELRASPVSATRQHAGADRRLHSRDQPDDARDRGTRQRGPLCRGVRPIRGVGRYIAMLVRRGRRHRSLTDRQAALLLGRTNADGPQLRPAPYASAHLTPGRASTARGHSSRPPSTRPAAVARCARPSNASPSAGCQVAKVAVARKVLTSASTACATDAA
jgi:hypothetical protein